MTKFAFTRGISYHNLMDIDDRIQRIESHIERMERAKHRSNTKISSLIEIDLEYSKKYLKELKGDKDSLLDKRK